MSGDSGFVGFASKYITTCSEDQIGNMKFGAGDNVVSFNIKLA